jgi:hypothetical protein
VYLFEEGIKTLRCFETLVFLTPGISLGYLVDSPRTHPMEISEVTDCLGFGCLTVRSGIDPATLNKAVNTLHVRFPQHFWKDKDYLVNHRGNLIHPIVITIRWDREVRIDLTC